MTEHVIHRYWCGTCKRIVEPVIATALPKSTLGLRTVVYTAWLHYCLGLTLDKIVALLNVSAHFKITAGGLCHAWRNLAAVLQPAYDQIGGCARASAVLHGDETGWRVNGKTHWLWCFTNTDLAYFVIDRCRGSPVVLKILGELFSGVLITDFFGAYNRIAALAKQKCLAHLLRELAKVDVLDSTPAWRFFRRKLKRLLKDAFRLASQRDAFSPAQLARKKSRFLVRLMELCAFPHANRHARRLSRRLLRYQNELFTFLDHPQVPPDNNHAERQIRPAVIMRKNSYCNRSRQGADAQALLMSVFRTLQLRGLHPVQTVIAMVEKQLQSGQPSVLPSRASIG